MNSISQLLAAAYKQIEDRSQVREKKHDQNPDEFIVAVAELAPDNVDQADERQYYCQ
jgi:hypothetical protein